MRQDPCRRCQGRTHPAATNTTALRRRTTRTTTRTRRRREVCRGGREGGEDASAATTTATTTAATRTTRGKGLEGCPWVKGVRVLGCGSKVPNRIVTNTDLERLVETNDEWIRTRTGICERRVLGEGEDLSSLAAEAAREALKASGVAPEELDLIILATSSSDDLFGSACSVQAALGAPQAACFDLTSACSGFVVGLITGAQYIRSGAYGKILVVGADALSRFVDWTDRNTCILFGDGCGACVLGAQDPSEFGCNLLSFHIESDGTGRKHLNAGFSGFGDKSSVGTGAEERGKEGSYANICMSGQDVFKWAVRAVPSVVQKAVESSDLSTVGDIDWLVLHQANTRILESAAQRLGIPSEKVISNIDKYGNTSAASVPLALDEAVKSGQIKKGDVIATAGFGAGLTAASAVFLWD
ncbi:3-oxoacyl-[acyl-carrier-protein] synthase [Chloropicon primus]|uniref:beta-ketoacyl-[acyl-carrier-protein] synthase III n=2 Tax=Chloropicon primus TaxID=1764295 RepID=A0A5B8MPA2_9CHLO|nr:3-oxoacyl-[acyl-carrier-protein] synthase [Chloropicon primus]UPR01729.1 3-oxoacyl-[acyl-carrier-protein] synthase [Chloropicon primus]|eukprot:QDZ22508.1 3-oxoacyl-[acyl-carrier-protein] synthase [Chloropicon primus]